MLSAGSHIENNFRIWISFNHNVRMNLDGNQLANVRRDMLNSTAHIIGRTFSLNETITLHLGFMLYIYIYIYIHIYIYIRYIYI